MKSLLISSRYFPPQTGGISHFMGAIASALGADRVCCLTGVTANDGKDFPFRIYRRPLAFAQSKAIQAVGWGMAISQIMAREHPQVVQIATAYDAYLGLWLRRWFKLPLVIYAHGNEILDAIKSKYQKPLLALRHADRLMANSKFTSELLKQAGVESSRIEIVHPGCDTKRFQPLHPRIDLKQKLLGPRYKDRIILTVGGLMERKGHDMVIRALPKLLQHVSNVTYMIVGEGPFRAQLETLAVAMGVRDRVIFVGLVPEEDLPDIYALCNVFAMPSRERLESCDVEGFGLVFLEANACGKAVVGGRSGGITDAIIDGVTGLLVDPHNPEDIAKALGQLLSDSDLAMRMGHQGCLRAVRDFGWEKIASRVQSILDSTLREKMAVDFAAN